MRVREERTLGYGEVLWTPPPDVRERTELGRYLDWLARERRLEFDDYDALWRWSVTDLEAFWGSLWDFFELRAHTPYERVVENPTMPGAVWFRGATLNYAENMLGRDEDVDRIAVLARSQTRDPFELTFGDLRDQVARARAGLQRLGVEQGDRVVAYLPNIPETLVAFLATASLGAIWATCPPEFGVRSVVDRLGQLEPKVLLAVAGYQYGDKTIDRRGEVATIRERLPTLETVVHVPYVDRGIDELPEAHEWGELVAEPAPLAFDPVPFAHPLFVLFSSGTTGLPKAIVHGHGGILIEALKNHGLSWDLHDGDRLQWFTTTAWMMWNALASTLLTRASIVMIDGSPGYPDLSFQWQLAEETRPTMLGLSPAFIMACRKEGLQPGRDFDLSSIRCLGVAGSPLALEGFAWLDSQFDDGVLLNLGCGGTDICTGIVQGNPLLPVYAGEMAGRCLGVAATAFDENGQEVVGELGELVITQPLPTMPIRFWNDPGDTRYHASYFEDFPGVWRHGDWILFTERGSSVVTGRSDATLNRGGVRLGTGEFYAAIEELDEVLDSLVVHLEDRDELVLFVVLREGVELDDDLRRRVAATLRGALSPRHVPDTILAVSEIPRTLTGKKLELPIKRILTGTPAEEVVSPDALATPEAIEPFVALAAARTRS